jgi:amino acid transporter
VTETAAPPAPAADVIGQPAQLKRTIGFWGLSFISLGSIIGSGWLLGALTAAATAGGASIITWFLAAIMIMVLAIIHADLGAAYPVAGGTARYPHYAFGGLTGFTAGWATYLQAIALAPIEVEATIGYVNSLPAVHDGFNMLNLDGTLNGRGVIMGILAIALFSFINLMGASWLSDSNTGIVLWKIFVPLLTIVALMLVTFHPGNFTAGGGFMPYGWHGVFAALPAGAVFALQGFEQASQMAGEAKNPKKHVAKAIILAMSIGALIYVGLEIAFVGALNPAHLVDGWAHPVGAGDFGPYYSLAISAGIGWLAIILIIDAVVSPGGTGLLYIGTSARISYALGIPKALTRVSRRGVPIWSILVASLFGVIALLPAPSWQELVSLTTGATAIMYSFAPISLRALMKADVRRTHPYRVPVPALLLPLGFIFANLIIYWGGFGATWKLSIGILIGQLILGLAVLLKARNVDLAGIGWRAVFWIWPWLGGMVLLGWLGNYGGKADALLHVLPEDWDAFFIAAWSLIIFYFASNTVQSADKVEAAVARDEPEPVLAASQRD